MKDTFDKHIYRVLLSSALLVLAIGTVFYHLVEKLSWVNSYYFSVVTLTTVGYGDLAPHTNAGKIFTTFYLMIGVGIITAFISYTLKRQGDKFANRNNKK
jgi:voltage-gated potassium channel